MKAQTLAPAQAFDLTQLITATEQGIASRVLAKTAGGNLTLFAFDEGQTLSEHRAPFDALVLVLSGELILIIEGQPVKAQPGSIVRMPANIPHALEATTASRMLLVLLKEEKGQSCDTCE